MLRKFSGRKVKGFPEDSINFLLNGDRLSDNMYQNAY
jgi:hypothetical protein